MIHNPRRPHWETLDGKQRWHEGHGFLCTCQLCTAWDQEQGDAYVADAERWNADKIVALQCLPSGNVVLYDGTRRPFYIGDWFGVKAAYEARPKLPRSAMERVLAPKMVVTGIDLTSLDIQL